MQPIRMLLSLKRDDRPAGSGRAVSAVWKAPPTFIEHIFSSICLLENSTIERALRRLFRGTIGLNLPSELSSEAAA